MTDNSRPTPGSDPKKGGAGDSSPRPRKRRRRGSRPASGAARNAGTEKNQAAKPDGASGAGGGKEPAKASGSAKSGGNRSNRRRRGRGSGRGRNQRQNTSRYRSNHRGSHHADTTMETRDETSAGGLVVSGMAEAVGPGGKVDLSRIYVALIGRLDRRGRLLWSMPKGHVEDGEHQWTTAEREVWEETGILGEAFEELGVIDYWFVSEGVRIHKTVHHNLLRYVDGVLNDEDPEVTEVTWVPMSELIEHLAYADERKLARIAVDRMPAIARKEADAGRATPR
ncbi:NUDIX hydrolase [Corynebacterium mycetoides]|nr:NUDIX hydrolase [Corynebacterium mycetoides]